MGNQNGWPNGCETQFKALEGHGGSNPNILWLYKAQWKCGSTNVSSSLAR